MWLVWTAPHSGPFISHTSKLSHNLDGPNNLLIELRKICRWNPIFPVPSFTDLAHRILAQELCFDLKLQNVSYVSGSLVLGVPVPGNLRGVLQVQYGIEVGLLGQAGRKCSKTVCPDEIEFGPANRAEQSGDRQRRIQNLGPACISKYNSGSLSSIDTGVADVITQNTAAERLS